MEIRVVAALLNAIDQPPIQPPNQLFLPTLASSTTGGGPGAGSASRADSSPWNLPPQPSQPPTVHLSQPVAPPKGPFTAAMQQLALDPRSALTIDMFACMLTDDSFVPGPRCVFSSSWRTSSHAPVSVGIHSNNSMQ